MRSCRFSGAEKIRKFAEENSLLLSFLHGKKPLTGEYKKIVEIENSANFVPINLKGSYSNTVSIINEDAMSEYRLVPAKPIPTFSL